MVAERSQAYLEKALLFNNEEYRRVYGRFKEFVFTRVELEALKYHRQLETLLPFPHDQKRILINLLRTAIRRIDKDQQRQAEEFEKKLEKKDKAEPLDPTLPNPYSFIYGDQLVKHLCFEEGLLDQLPVVETLLEAVADVVAEQKDARLLEATKMHSFNDLDKLLLQEDLIRTFDVYTVAGWTAVAHETNSTIDFTHTPDVENAWADFFARCPGLTKLTTLAVAEYQLDKENPEKKARCISALSACYFYLRHFGGLYPFQIFHYRKYLTPLLEVLNLEKDGILPLVWVDPEVIYQLVLEQARR